MSQLVTENGATISHPLEDVGEHCAATRLDGATRTEEASATLVESSEAEEPFFDLSLAYSHRQVAPNVHQVIERYYESGNRANIWVVEGRDRDLVIDAGLGLFNVAEYLDQCGLINPPRKPVLAVATHVHFDHSGGLRYFSDVAIHTAEADSLVNGNNRDCVTFLSDDEITLKPDPNWKAKQYQVQPTKVTQRLSDGDMLDLGDRCLRVIHLPGHSPGSIALLDVGSDRSLFSGDVVYDTDSLIDWLPHSNASAYVASAHRLESLAKSGSVAQVFPGHGNSFGPEKLIQLTVNYQHSANGFGSKLARGMMKASSSVYLKFKHKAHGKAP